MRYMLLFETCGKKGSKTERRGQETIGVNFPHAFPHAFLHAFPHAFLHASSTPSRQILPHGLPRLPPRPPLHLPPHPRGKSFLTASHAFSPGFAANPSSRPRGKSFLTASRQIFPHGLDQSGPFLKLTSFPLTLSLAKTTPRLSQRFGKKRIPNRSLKQFSTSVGPEEDLRQI